MGARFIDLFHQPGIHAEPACKGRKGIRIELIYRKLLGELESQGLTKIEALGQEFDPNFHQAVLYEEGEEGKVIEELQKGYMVHDRLLRPTMVKVGKGKE